MPTAVLLLARARAHEPGTTFKASAIVPAKLLKGPHHAVSEEVEARRLTTSSSSSSRTYGDIAADGRTVLRTRVPEVDALARLSEVSKGEVFAKAAGGAVLNVGKGVASVVTEPRRRRPRASAAGSSAMGVNLGRKSKRAADNVTKDDKKPEGDAKPAEDKALDAAGGAANSVIGVNGAARKWAQKLRVDPYTSNPVLHKALVDVGKIDAAGSIVTKVVGAHSRGRLHHGHGREPRVGQGPRGAAQDERGAAHRAGRLEAGGLPVPRQRQLHAHQPDPLHRRAPRGEGEGRSPTTSTPRPRRRTSARRCSSWRAPRCWRECTRASRSPRS